MTQFIDTKKCEFYGECVYRMNIPVGYYSANIACQYMQMSLADILNAEKQVFLDGGSTFAKKKSSFFWNFTDTL